MLWSNNCCRTNREFIQQEISGVTKTTGGSVNGIVRKPAYVTNVELVIMIPNTYRTKFDKDEKHDIAVKLANKQVKDKLSNAVKTRARNGNPVLCVCLGSFSTSRVYVNDLLSKYNEKLLKLAKLTGRSYGYK